MKHQPRRSSDRLVARSSQEIAAAQVPADAGFAAQAASRAYFAAFFAAEAALIEVGETRSKHRGVIAIDDAQAVVEAVMSWLDDRP